MKTLRFKKMDAFTRGEASGNPAGCIYLEDGQTLSEGEMLRIARELKGFVNEVGYLGTAKDCFVLKYYSSECEVDFCGHATIGILYDLIKADTSLIEKKEISIHVNAGKLSVFNHINEDDAVYIMAPSPQFLQWDLPTNKVAGILNVNDSGIEENLPLRVINAGLRTLIVPLTSLDTCLSIYPNQEQLRLFCLANDIDIILIFSNQTSLTSSQYRTRVFAPKYGYLEDPATGSGNAAFGHYLIKEGLWSENVIIEQGPSRDNPNIIKLRRHQKEKQDRVLFGGASVLRIDGKYLLHD